MSEGENTIEEIIEMSKESDEPFYLGDGKVIFLGKVYNSMEEFAKVLASVNNFSRRLDTIIRFVTFGKRSFIPKK